MILYKNGRALIGDRLVKTDIAANHGRIIEIAPEIVADEQTEVVDCANRYILPALVDLCSYGAAGYDFNTADADGMKKIMEYYIAHGVGTVFPTLKPDADGKLCAQLALIAALAKDYPEIKGIHLDGPFVSPDCCDSRGQFAQKPSMDKFVTYQKAAEGKIKLMTVAPELDDALAFISEAADSKVIVSAGRSNADFETLKKALKAGAKGVTDWGNGMSALSRKDLGVAGGALLADCYCMAVFDGTRVDKSVLPLLQKAKGDKLVAVTGDSNDAYQGLANTVTFCNLPLYDAIKLWTVNPAKFVGLSDLIGTIQVNKHADFILFG